MEKLDTPEKIHDWMLAHLRYQSEAVNEYGHASVIFQRHYGDCDDHAILARYALEKHGYEAWHLGIDNHASWGHNVAPFRDRDGRLFFLDNFGVKRGPFASFEAMADDIIPGWEKIRSYDRQADGCQFPSVVNRIER